MVFFFVVFLLFFLALSLSICFNIDLMDTGLREEAVERRKKQQQPGCTQKCNDAQNTINTITIDNTSHILHRFCAAAAVVVVGGRATYCLCRVTVCMVYLSLMFCILHFVCGVN